MSRKSSLLQRFGLESPEKSQTSKSVNKLRILHEMGKVIASTLELKEILTRVTEAATSISQTEESALYLLNDISGEIYLVAEKRLHDESIRTIKEKVNNSVINTVIEKGESIRLNQKTKLTTEFMVKSLLCVPISSKEDTIGALCVLNRQKTQMLTKTDEYLLDTLSDYAAIAIENAKLLDKLNQKNQILTELYEFNKSLKAEDELQRILENIAETALKFLSADIIVLYEYDNESGGIRVPPIIKGRLNRPNSFRETGKIIPDKESVIFKILDRKSLFFASNAPKDWENAGLIQSHNHSKEEDFITREHVASSVGIPLLAFGNPVGVLFVNYRKYREFLPQLKERTTLFVTQAALAIRNARILSSSQRYVEQLSVLNDIGQELGQATPQGIDEILNLVYEQAKRLMDVTNFFVALYDGENNSVTFNFAVEGNQRPVLGKGQWKTRQAGNGLTEYIIRTKKPLLISHGVESWIEANGIKPIGSKAKSWLGAPMITRNEVIGIIALQSYKYENAYDREQCDVLSTIASQAASAVDNARLFDKVQKQLKELVALYDVTREITRTNTEIKSVFDLILSKAVQLTDAPAGLLMLSNNVEKYTKVVATLNIDALKGFKTKYGEGVAGEVSKTGESLIINDYKNWANKVSRNSTNGVSQITAMVAVPMKSLDSVIGVLALCDIGTGRSFDNGDKRLLERFASPAAIAINNTRLFSFQQALANGSADAIFAANIIGQVTQCNKGAETLTGYSREELINMSADKIYWGGAKEAKRIGSLLQKHSRVDEIETFLKSKDGEKIPVLFSGGILSDETYDIIGTVGFLQDLRVSAMRGKIRRLLHTLQELSQAEQLQSVFDTIVLGTVEILQADFCCIFIFEEGNLSIKSQFGLPTGLIEDYHIQIGEGLTGTAFEKERTLTVDYNASNNNYFPLGENAKSAIAVFIGIDGKPLGVILAESRRADHFMNDEPLNILASQSAFAINRAQLSEENEFTLEKLQASAHAIAVGNIATGFVHEVKNAINNIAMTIGNIGDSLQKEQGIKRKQVYLDKIVAIESQADRLVKLALRLQRFERRLEPSMEMVSLNNVVKSAMELLGSSIERKKLKFDLDLESALDTQSVYIDPEQIEQVIINLTLNAIDASPSRKKLLFKTESLADKVAFHITDYGSGVDPELIGEIFQPFFTTKAEGVGLGLYISKLIIEEHHHGELEVKSRPGKGSTFSIYLPK